MTPEQQRLWEEAQRSLDAAKLLRKEGYFGFAVSRAYYAMFHAAEALLLTKGLTHSRHAAVISAFGREFAKLGVVPQDLHRFLIEGMELRQIGDYGRSFDVTAGQCDEQIKHAETFLCELNRHLQ